MRDFREPCCNCGLIHRLDFRLVDGRIEFRTPRQPRHRRGKVEVQGEAGGVIDQPPLSGPGGMLV
jgi:hypothetical protein